MTATVLTAGKRYLGIVVAALMLEFGRSSVNLLNVTNLNENLNAV